MSKTTGMILGIILAVVGIILAIFGLVSFFGASQNIQNIQGGFMNAGMGIVMIFIGAVLLITGIMIIYLTNIGKIFSYIATEASPGAEKITHAVGKGLASGVKKGWKEK